MAPAAGSPEAAPTRSGVPIATPLISPPTTAGRAPGMRPKIAEAVLIARAGERGLATARGSSDGRDTSECLLSRRPTVAQGAPYTRYSHVAPIPQWHNDAAFDTTSPHHACPAAYAPSSKRDRHPPMP